MSAPADVSALPGTIARAELVAANVWRVEAPDGTCAHVDVSWEPSTPDAANNDPQLLSVLCGQLSELGWYGRLRLEPATSERVDWDAWPLPDLPVTSWADSVEPFRQLITHPDDDPDVRAWLSRDVGVVHAPSDTAVRISQQVWIAGWGAEPTFSPTVVELTSHDAELDANGALELARLLRVAAGWLDSTGARR